MGVRRSKYKGRCAESAAVAGEFLDINEDRLSDHADPELKLSPTPIPW
jgi:hypothetical protein